MAKPKKLERSKESLVRELYDKGLSVKEVLEQTNFRRDMIVELVRIFNKGYESSDEYRQKHAYEKGFESHIDYVYHIKQRGFEKTIKKLPVNKFKKISLDNRIGLTEDVEFLLDKLEKNYHNGPRLRHILELRYFDEKDLSEIGNEQDITKQRVYDLETEAIKKLKELIKVYNWSTN